MPATQVALSEYLKTVYEPDPDYVDGGLEGRNVGERDHAAVQAFLSFWFKSHPEWGLALLPEMRMLVTETRVRVGDLVLVSMHEAYDDVLTRPPVAVIEILSPEDRSYRYKPRLADYSQMGISHI